MSATTGQKEKKREKRKLIVSLEVGWGWGGLNSLRNVDLNIKTKGLDTKAGEEIPLGQRQARKFN